MYNFDPWSIALWEDSTRRRVKSALLSRWYSEFNESWFILIYKLIGGPDIFKRLFLLLKTQNICLTARKKLFLKQPGPQRGTKIEMRIIGIAHNFLFLFSYSSPSKWNTLADMDGLWVAMKATPGHHDFLGLWLATQLLLTTIVVSVWGSEALTFYCQLGKGLSPDGSCWLYKIFWKNPLSPVGMELFSVIPLETHSFL